ncbi:MAG: DUF4339 domain-containing protein [Paludibacteraceae bacterium]|nr:DUF4339 domain-containing protein [Paludibacteraceae bacterium]
MNPQDFDALVSAGTGFFTQNQMVNSGAVTQMSQQAIQNVQAMQTPPPFGNVPQAVSSPVFDRIDQERRAAAGEAATEQLQFFVLINGAQKGPISLEQLKGLAIVDVIDENTQVWRQGTPEWTDLKNCLANLN